MLRVRLGAEVLTFEDAVTVTIGRDPDSAIRIADPRISRRHAECRFDGNSWFFQDLGSRNGAYCDGKPAGTLRLDRPRSVRLGGERSGVLIELIPEPALVSVAFEDTQPLDVMPDQETRPAPLNSAVLAAEALGDRSARYRPEQTALRIGRAPDNDVVVDDFLVSRHHAELRRRADGGFTLVDLESHNGSFVNGQRVKSADIGGEDYLTIGSHLFRLVDGSLEQYVDSGQVSFDVLDLTVQTRSGQTLLDRVTFPLEKRSFLAVLGPTGAGKSTLLKALTGVQPAQAGSVFYAGRDLYTSYAELKQRIGYVPQDDILHPQLNLETALDYAAQLRFPPDVPVDSRRQRVREVMEELGLTERASVPIQRLSGGQRKRASVALELLSKPSLLVLDEPTSGLDPGYVRAIMRLLRSLADGGRTIIVTTHSENSLELCDRHLWLAPGGKVAYFGPPQEALAYFHQTDYLTVWDELEHDQGTDWQARFQEDRASETYVREPLAKRRRGFVQAQASVESPPPPRRWRDDLGTLIRRYLTIIGSDRRNLLLLLLQAPVLGALILAIAPANSFVPGSTAHAQMVALMLIFAATLMGASNAIREIVKELPIYQRERASGLSIPAYLASKFFVLLGLTVLQSIVLVFIATLRQGGPPTGALIGSVGAELMVDVALAGVASMAVALLVSALVSSSDTALTLLPLLLIPQIVLSGGLVSIQNTPVLQELSFLMSARWGLAAVASTVDLNGLNRSAQPGVGAAYARPGLLPAADPLWSHAAGTWLGDGLALVMLTAAALAVTLYMLRRRDPSR